MKHIADPSMSLTEAAIIAYLDQPEGSYENLQIFIKTLAELDAAGDLEQTRNFEVMKYGKI